MRLSRSVLVGVVFALAGAMLAVPGRASAQSSADAAAAEALFNEASAEMEAGRYETACPKLEESFRLDPATGALLALAACYERAGKLASAWVRYLDVEARAGKEGDKDRAAVAHQKASELAPRLPRLAIELAPAVASVASVEVRRDGAVVAAATLGTPIPVDPGGHVVEVRAPGRIPFRREVTAVVGGTETVRVDSMQVDGGAPRAVEPPPDASPGDDDGGLTGLQIAGLVVGGTGVVALGVGFGFGAAAAGASSDLDSIDGYEPETGACAANLAECQDRYDAASTAATVSTALVIGGGVLAAAGAVMVLLGGDGPSDAAKLEVMPTLGGFGARGAF